MPPTTRKKTTTPDVGNETIRDLLVKCREDVGAVRKLDTNQHFGFSFRGVDTVINSVVPVFNAHGILFTPHALEVQPAGGGVIVKMRYDFIGPAGDTHEVTVFGQGNDVIKAQSIALRIALLQALTLPTDEPDPEAAGPLSAAPDPLYAPKLAVREAWEALGGSWDPAACNVAFRERHDKDLREASAEELDRFAAHLLYVASEEGK